MIAKFQKMITNLNKKHKTWTYYHSNHSKIVYLQRVLKLFTFQVFNNTNFSSIIATSLAKLKLNITLKLTQIFSQFCATVLAIPVNWSISTDILSRIAGYPCKNKCVNSRWHRNSFKSGSLGRKFSLRIADLHSDIFPALK